MWKNLFILAFGVSLYALDTSLIELPDTNQKVEIYTDNPESSGKGIILFLHGGGNFGGVHNFRGKPLTDWQEKGYVVAGVSLPGFGRSSGDADLCGPETIQSLGYAIDRIKEQGSETKVGIIGFGYGAMAATLLTTVRDDIAFVISANGLYDVGRQMGKCKFCAYNVDLTDEKEVLARSAMHHTDTIKTPLFLLHREGNPFIKVEEVIDFSEKLQGKECQLVVRKKSENRDIQKISYQEVMEEAEYWIEEKMRTQHETDFDSALRS